MKYILSILFFTLNSILLFSQSSTSAPETLTNNANSAQGIVLSPTSTFTPNLNAGHNDLLVQTSGSSHRTQLIVAPTGANKSAFFNVANNPNPNIAGLGRLGIRGEYVIFGVENRGGASNPSPVKHFAIELDPEQLSTDEAFVITQNGYNGTGSPTRLLKVHTNGIETIEAKVQATITPPDYVFADDYNLRPLEEVEEYIKKHSHLPEIPSASEFTKEGIKLGKMSFDLLKKVEELTLYMIELKSENQELKNRLSELEKAK